MSVCKNNILKRKIHVLQVPGSLRVGGLEKVSVNLLRYCNKEKYSFDYLVYGNSIEPLEKVVEELGGRVFHVSYPHENVMQYMKEVRTIMKEQGPYDVVHAHSLFNSGLVLKLAAQEGIAIRIAHAHSDRKNVKTTFFRKAYNYYMQWLINRYATQKFACSEGAGEYLYGEKHSKEFHIVKNGVDVKEFQYNPSLRKKIREEFKWENNTIIGHIGRLAYVKNQDKILNVFSQAYKIDPKLRLMIVGDGELRRKLEEKIKKLGLEEVAILTGTRRDIPALLATFDVYIMPSFYEGVSISLIEAQTSGLPCLVSENAASSETRITDNLTVMSLEDADESWAQKIIELSRRERNIDAVDDIIKNGYDVRMIVSEVLEYYKTN